MFFPSPICRDQRRCPFNHIVIRPGFRVMRQFHRHDVLFDEPDNQRVGIRHGIHLLAADSARVMEKQQDRSFLRTRALQGIFQVRFPSDFALHAVLLFRRKIAQPETACTLRRNRSKRSAIPGGAARTSPSARLQRPLSAWVAGMPLRGGDAMSPGCPADRRNARVIRMKTPVLHGFPDGDSYVTRL